MTITFIILIVATISFVWGKVRSDIVAVISMILLMCFNILTPQEALSGFSSEVVVLMIGIFIVGGALVSTGLAKLISGKIVKYAGHSELRLIILTILATAFIGSFVSNTGTVALMLPIVVSLAARTGLNQAKVLMPIAFASSMGGMMTLIGTTPNLVINATLKNAGFEALTFFSFTPVGIVCLSTGLLIMIPLSFKFLGKKKDNKSARKPRHKTSSDLEKEYQLSDNLYRVRVKKQSTPKGKSLMELKIPAHYKLNLLEIRSKSETRNPFFKSLDNKKFDGNTIIQEDDILYLLGEYENVKKFVTDNHLGLLRTQVLEKKDKKDPISKFDFRKTGIAEALILPNSTYINTPIQKASIREKFGLNILGIKRVNEYVLQNLQDETIQASDILLVQGSWEDISRMGEEGENWVILGQPLAEAAKVTMDHKAPVAAIITLLMILGMVSSEIPTVVSVLIAAILMIMTGCLKNVEDAYKWINWESVVLIAAMLPMSLALEKTGASGMISQKLVGGLGAYGPYALMAGIYFTGSLLTMFISNTATAVLLAPIAFQSALALEYSPYPFLFAVSVSTSMCFSVPFSTPPNALVMRAGGYAFTDYLKVGLPLQTIMGIIMIAALPLIFPFHLDTKKPSETNGKTGQTTVASSQTWRG